MDTLEEAATTMEEMAEEPDETDETADETEDETTSDTAPLAATMRKGNKKLSYRSTTRVTVNGSYLSLAVCLVLTATTVWLFREHVRLAQEQTTSHSLPHPVETVHAPNPSLCVDIDDNLTIAQINNASSSRGRFRCTCHDPSDSIPSGRLWMEHHDRLVLAAETSAKQQQAQQNLDVVLLGDSIIEFWNGTRNMGTQQKPSTRAVFDRFFDRANHPEATLQGLALGSSGDTTNHILWHLENGLLPDNFQPKVWLLMIGTNNMGRDGCAKQPTAAGILQVLRVLQQARPNAAVIVHGLLPRSDGGRPNKYKLGRLWANIVWINAELKKQCRLLHNCFYMDSGDAFLRKNEDNNELEIDQILMQDALHPTDAGYAAWGPLIVAEVKRVISLKKP